MKNLYLDLQSGRFIEIVEGGLETNMLPTLNYPATNRNIAIHGVCMLVFELHSKGIDLTNLAARDAIESAVNKIESVYK